MILAPYHPEWGMSGKGEYTMLGPALSQMLSDLAEIPNGERTEYEWQLYRELRFLVEIKGTMGPFNLISIAQAAIGETANFSDKSILLRTKRPSCTRADCPNKAQ